MNTMEHIDRPTWPPLMAEIVGNLYFIRIWLTLGQETTYPLPKNLLPIDLEKKAAKRKSSSQCRRVRQVEQICIEKGFGRRKNAAGEFSARA
jgi:hypothetical protein